MIRRKKPARREAELAFEALFIEGGLLSPEWLSKVASLEAGQQSEADYRVQRGLGLRDEIGRFWRIAQPIAADFAAAVAGGVDAAQAADRFVLALLRDAFGFASLLSSEPVVIADRTYPVRFRALGGRVPVVIAPAGLGLDTPTPAFGEPGRRRSAFGLAQELLNADENALWAIATDGVRLRVLRDNGSLTRPAWIEADLGRIFAEQRYADFAALWLLVHESRFGGPDKPVTDCALEAWRTAGREEGTRARDHLRQGVEEALVAFGQGFLAHAENTTLRAALHDGSLTTTAYFQELLRLVYRLLFLLTAEERDVLHPPDTSAEARALYASGYGVRLLRDRSVRRSAHDRFSDLWQGLRIVFSGLASGEPRLGLPSLGGLFHEDRCPHLDGCKLENRHLLYAVFRLSWLREEAGLARVNWRDMGPEELGSVYESLLELVPQIRDGGRAFAFATGAETKGNARKTTGSYYTPDSLVQVLLDSALEPVVADTLAKNPTRPVEALLDLAIVDPACGSGHFLLSAARRLAGHVARLSSTGTPSAAEYRHALRQVVARSVYGVDLNPMAVELCKVSLWMEAVEPGLPLTFLDSHIQHGNSLLGTTPELMAKGIPDAAWEAIEGDDKKVASALKKRNKAEAGGQRSLDTLWSSSSSDTEAKAVAHAVAELERQGDASPAALAQKEAAWGGILGSDAYKHQKLVADAWCAAFVWPKPTGASLEAAPTNGLWRQLRDGQKVPAETVKTVEELAEQYRFFHWHLQFPQVVGRGGFDVVLGNPPWERVKLQEQEFFASKSEDIAAAINAAARKKLIAKLPESDPALWCEWRAASRRADGESHVVRDSGRYPLCGKGDVNTYALFAEHNRATLGLRGRSGFIVPTGVATDDTTKDYFGSLVRGRELVAFLSFENEQFVFPAVHHAFKFALLTLSRTGDIREPDLFFFARQVSDLRDSSRHFAMSASDFDLLNPNTRTCPTFRSARDARLNREVYRRTDVLWREEGGPSGNPWALTVRTRLWHMAEDSEWFRPRSWFETRGAVLRGADWWHDGEQYAPLREAKMLHHFDHRFATYEGQTPAQENQGKLPELDADAHSSAERVGLPYYWVQAAEVASRLGELWQRRWLLGWRDICRSTDQRTLIASIVPWSATGDTFMLALPGEQAPLVPALYANLCSFVLDYAARQKVGGTHLKLHTLRQLPVLAPATHAVAAPWAPMQPAAAWLLSRVIELTYTAWDLDPFARDVGYDGPPFRWDPERRFLLRCELDAAFFHLYGLSRDDTDYVMETFPIVRKNDEKAHGEYRTKRVILEIYDAMAEAARTGKPYQTRLDPPPADPRVAHPPRSHAPALLPSPSLAGLTALEWERPHSNETDEAIAALAAVLKAGGKMPRRDVRLAATLVLEPRLLLGALDATETVSWRRTVGSDADPLPPGVAAFAPRADAAWGQAVRHLLAKKGIIEDVEAQMWAPGPGVEGLFTEGWPDGRAAVVLGVMRRQGVVRLVAGLPEPFQRWIHADAA